MMESSDMAALWKEGRSRLLTVVTNIKAEDLQKKLGDAPNSAGFLLRHIAEVELMFSKMIFDDNGEPVEAKTLMAQKDTGEWTVLPDLMDYLQKASGTLENGIKNQPADSWQESITTKIFGTKTRAEYLGRIISHTSYHAGQLAIILKYGK
jgi:uncharacterized damage-inducible protein DinB